MNLMSSLVDELRNREYRSAFVTSQIETGIPFQIRAIRKNRGMTQPELARSAGMSQPRISEVETPGARRLSLDTLLRIAEALDIALQVKFVTFGELVRQTESMNLDKLNVESFTSEVERRERQNAAKFADASSSVARTTSSLHLSLMPKSDESNRPVGIERALTQKFSEEETADVFLFAGGINEALSSHIG
jgi:transcriptional regulator with XRE-family HTH domain